ncbi:MAG: isochorismatase family protein [Candidatus Latescibacteria bacterium]|nr:isochorismatase family protein [Candidatus Latescibacterota bacterium]
MEKALRLDLRTQVLGHDPKGRTSWQVVQTPAAWPAEQTALLLCDVWDLHWSRGANERLAPLLPRMGQVVRVARSLGVRIVHAPSDTMAFYEGMPARQRVQAAKSVEPPTPAEREDPPQPVDASDSGTDTGEPTWHKAWSRQHPAIHIDQERDGISDQGREVYSFLRGEGRNRLLIMGVHTNMCVLNRSFAIKQMVKWGMEVALLGDLTDTMYNPARSPYVSHEEGTRLVVEYIEKFWCATALSEDVLRSAD